MKSNLLKKIKDYCKKPEQGTEESVKVHAIICGFWRSGTTWLAEIINTIPAFSFLFEPLNPDGVPEARKLHHYMAESIPAGENIQELENLFSRIIRKEYSNEWLLRTTTKKKFLKSTNIGFKFVRSSMLMPWFIEKYSVKYPIFIMRHPFSSIASVIKLKWSKRTCFGMPPETDYFRLFHQYWDILKNITTNVEFLAALWCLEFVAMKEVKNALTIKYEDLILDPHASIENIFQFLDTKITKACLERINKPSKTSYGQCNIEDKKHMLNRWREIIHKKDIKLIQRIVNQFEIKDYDLSIFDS